MVMGGVCLGIALFVLQMCVWWATTRSTGPAVQINVGDVNG